MMSNVSAKFYFINLICIINGQSIIILIKKYIFFKKIKLIEIFIFATYIAGRSNARPSGVKLSFNHPSL